MNSTNTSIPFNPRERSKNPAGPDRGLHLVDATQFGAALWEVLQITMTPNKAWRWRQEGLPFWPIRPRMLRYDVEEGIQWFLRCGKVAENMEASVNQALYLHLQRLNRSRSMEPFQRAR